MFTSDENDVLQPTALIYHLSRTKEAAFHNLNFHTNQRWYDSKRQMNEMKDWQGERKRNGERTHRAERRSWKGLTESPQRKPRHLGIRYGYWCRLKHQGVVQLHFLWALNALGWNLRRGMYVTTIAYIVTTIANICRRCS